MKNSALLFLTITVFFSCKQDTKTNDYKNETLDVTTSIYPENISKIFDAHGGLNNWNAMQSLVFTIPKPDGDEITTTNLKSRESYEYMYSVVISISFKDSSFLGMSFEF